MSNKTNIYNHLFAYIKSNSDLTVGMAQMYENSLIFIGDEKQIWQPKTNAYVGIGMTAYNSIFDAVSNSANTIRQYSTNVNGSYFITFSSNSDNGVFANSYVNTELRFNPFTKTAYSSYYEGQLDPKDQWGYIGVIIRVTGVSIDGVVPTLLVGDSLTLSAIVTPDYASDTSVTWSSSANSVATVTNDGVVVAVGDGTATITVTTNDGSFTDTCNLTVNVPIVHVIGVSINGAMSPLLAGDTLQLSATVFPSDATDKSVTWSSSDTSIASVSSSGLVTAISGGNVTITATTTDGSYTSTCYISINGIINVIGVSISGSESTLPIGGTTTLIATIAPDDATYKSVTWSSSDASIATVDSSGVVKALSTGNATITVTTTDGSHSDTYLISVTDYVDLGLSVMWRNRNIGATNPENSGLFFAWGETTGYESASARNTALGRSDGFTTNSYNTRSAASISGDIQPSDDAARAYLGGAWRMPTREEFTELYNGTDHANTTINGVAGVKFMKKTDNDIYVFFPFCGYNGDKLYNYNGAGYYWSTKRYNSARAIEMRVSPSSITTTGDDGKQWGISIRPVIEYNAGAYDYSKDYLTFRVLTAGTVLWKALGSGYTRTIQYSLNGASWQSITSASTAPSISVSVGDVIKLRGTNSTYAGSKNDYSGFVGGTATFNAEGNIMSLVYGETFTSSTTLTGTYNFCSMFKQTNVISAQNMVLPATTLTNYCYRAMFSLATTLQQAPALPATTLAQGVYWYMFESCAITTAPDLLAPTLTNECYGHMFTNCTSLRYIKCLATGGLSSTDCKAGWVNAVASSGTFVKSSSVSTSTWSRGNNGIPSNWTVVDGD